MNSKLNIVTLGIAALILSTHALAEPAKVVDAIGGGPSHGEGGTNSQGRERASDTIDSAVAGALAGLAQSIDNEKNLQQQESLSIPQRIADLIKLPPKRSSGTPNWKIVDDSILLKKAKDALLNGNEQQRQAALEAIIMKLMKETMKPTFKDAIDKFKRSNQHSFKDQALQAVGEIVKKDAIKNQLKELLLKFGLNGKAKEQIERKFHLKLNDKEELRNRLKEHFKSQLEQEKQLAPGKLQEMQHSFDRTVDEKIPSSTEGSNR